MSETKEPYSAEDNTRLVVTNLSLSDLHQTLNQRGIAISYTSLSEFISADDIAEQLQSKNVRNRKEFPKEAADVLAAFLPEYREVKGRLPQAARLLRSFLNNRNMSRQALPSEIAETPKQSATDNQAEHLARLTGMGAEDCILTAHDAAGVLGISVGLLRKSVRSYRRFGKSPTGDRWRLSDLFREEGSEVSETPKRIAAKPEIG